MAVNKSKRYQQQGFTLIEIVVGLVIGSIAMAGLVSFFFSQTARTIEPMLQVRAAKIGEALMDEALSKRYAEPTPVGGYPPCSSLVECGVLGMDAGEFSVVAGEQIPNRIAFDDVDDYNGYCAKQWPIEDVLANTAPVGSSGRLKDFQNYFMTICVIYDDNYDGVSSGFQAKLITITIFPPAGAATPIEFKAYRSNF